MRFQIGLVNMLCIEGIFENVIRIAKPPLNIAYSPRVVGVDVVNRGGELWQALIILESFVKLRRALGDRDQGIEHGRQFFVFYPDILCRFFCNVFVFGCNDRDFFTAKRTRSPPSIGLSRSRRPVKTFGISAAVKTAMTTGCAFAREVSMRTIRA